MKILAIVTTAPYITAGRLYEVKPSKDGPEYWEVQFTDNAHFNINLFKHRFAAGSEKATPTPVLKDTTPKDAIGSSKLSLGVVPDSLVIFAAMAYTEGDGKYGGYNYRVAGVRTSIYIDAAKRHMAKFWNGEDCDPVTKVPHLASVIACMGIILDAGHVGKLTDDRPPKADMAALIEQAEEVKRHLMVLHKDCHPKHYTQAAIDAEQA